MNSEFFFFFFSSRPMASEIALVRPKFVFPFLMSNFSYPFKEEEVELDLIDHMIG